MSTVRKLRPFNGRRGKPADAYTLPEGQYVIKTPDGRLGLTIRVSDGPHGLGVEIKTHVGTPKLTVADTDERYASIVQYRPTEQAQAFARWYQQQETEQDVQLLGESYRRAAK